MRGTDLILIDEPKPEEALSATQRYAANDWFDHPLQPAKRQAARRNCPHYPAYSACTKTIWSVICSAQEPWEVVFFPTIAETDELHEIETI